MQRAPRVYYVTTALLDHRLVTLVSVFTGVQENESGGNVLTPTPSSSERPVVAETKSKGAGRSRRERRRAGASAASVTFAGCPLVSTSSSAATAEDLSSKNPVRDLVARIYEEELRKLMSVAEVKGNVIDARMYEQEIKRLSFLRADSSGNVPVKLSPQPSTGGGLAEDKENVNGRY